MQSAAARSEPKPELTIEQRVSRVEVQQNFLIRYTRLLLKESGLRKECEEIDLEYANALGEAPP